MSEDQEMTTGEALERVLNMAKTLVLATEEYGHVSYTEEWKAVQMVEDLITNHYQE